MCPPFTHSFLALLLLQVGARLLPALDRLHAHRRPLALGLLHVSVLLRIGSGLAEWAAGRLASGVLTLAALLLFAGLLALSDKARRRPLQLRSN